MIEQIFEKVDVRIVELSAQNKTPSLILINARLYQNLQQEMLTQDLSQSYGKVRSPYNLRSYKGLQLLTSHVVDDVEVF